MGELELHCQVVVGTGEHRGALVALRAGAGIVTRPLPPPLSGDSIGGLRRNELLLRMKHSGLRVRERLLVPPHAAEHRAEVQVAAGDRYRMRGS
jgi:hypothetical protein